MVPRPFDGESLPRSGGEKSLDSQFKIVAEAFLELFELLEEYAPIWYTELQAIKAGRWHKVKALQRLLTCSYSGKVLAVRRVTENAGKKTPGVDGEIWDTPEKVHRLHLSVSKPRLPQKGDRRA